MERKVLERVRLHREKAEPPPTLQPSDSDRFHITGNHLESVENVIYGNIYTTTRAFEKNLGPKCPKETINFFHTGQKNARRTPRKSICLGTPLDHILVSLGAQKTMRIKYKRLLMPYLLGMLLRRGIWRESFTSGLHFFKIHYM